MNIRNDGDAVNGSGLEWDTLSKLLKHPIAFHRVFGKISGGALSGLFLSQAFYWTGVMQDKADERGEDWDGWFYKEQSDWEAETLMTRREQETARRDLKKRGLLEEKFGGLPRKLFYRLDRKAILKAIETETANNGGKRHYIKAESAATQRAKAPINKGQKRQALIGTETTTETKQKQQQGVVDFSHENVEPKTATDAALVASLQSLRVTKAGAITLVKTHPENARLVVEFLAAHPDKMPDSGGGVVLMIRDPEGWGVAHTNGAESGQDAPKAVTMKKATANGKKAAEIVYNRQNEGFQKAAKESSRGALGYTAFYRADEVAEVEKSLNAQ